MLWCFVYLRPMRFFSNPYKGPSGAGDEPPIKLSQRTRWLVLISFLAGALLLVDQQLETEFVAAPIEDIDLSSRRVSTAKGGFLAEFEHLGGPKLETGELVVMERSRITRTVVAYRSYEALLVERPRENIFTYWPLTLALVITSLILVVGWNRIGIRIELLAVNLILLIVVSVFYFISR